MPSAIDVIARPFSRLFAPLFSNRGRMRRNAENWLELADRVWNYGRDRMTPSEAQQLNARRQGLRQDLKGGADAAKLKLGIESLEAAMRRVGGGIYPRSALAENVEFFVVAAIVILGVRSYFLQPFEIPTNSMWPTYYGMTAVNYAPGAPTPNLARQALRFAAFGAFPKKVTAPTSGEVSALFFSNQYLAGRSVSGRTLFVFPSDQREYTFFVDGEPATIRVPADFSLDEFNQMVIQDYFGSQKAFDAYWERLRVSGGLQDIGQFRTRDDQAVTVYRVPLNRTVRQGEDLLRFDLLTGDKLFVDRFSYNFIRPRPGDGFVFRTANIPGIGMDQYYVKRLVGTPGDVIEVRPPVVYRNGAPITGASAFDLNARRVAPYAGYFNGEAEKGARYLLKGESLTVGPDQFFGMGDNSGNSSDGRYWGFIPAKDVAGRPLFIYYPFTRRWGSAR